MATNAVPGGAPVRKKTSPLVWILIGVVAFFMLMGVLVIAGGFFAYYKAKQAGLDPDMFKKNPALAAVNLALSANPDLEKVSIDEGRGTITVREKKTGKVYTMNFDDVKNGRFTFQENGKETVSIEAKGGGESGSVEVKSAEGTVKFGAGSSVKVPMWVPTYPGSSPEGIFSAQSPRGETGGFRYTTRDSAEKVTAYYMAELKRAGMRITSSALPGVVAGEADGRTLNVAVTTDSGGTHVSVNFEVKK